MHNFADKFEYWFIRIMALLSLILWFILPIATSIALSIELNSWYYLFGSLGIIITIPIGLFMASMWDFAFDD